MRVWLDLAQSISQFLSNPAWGGIGCIFSLISILFAIRRFLLRGKAEQARIESVVREVIQQLKAEKYETASVILSQVKLNRPRLLQRMEASLRKFIVILAFAATFMSLPWPVGSSVESENKVSSNLGFQPPLNRKIPNQNLSNGASQKSLKAMSSLVVLTPYRPAPLQNNLDNNNVTKLAFLQNFVCTLMLISVLGNPFLKIELPRYLPNTIHRAYTTQIGSHYAPSNTRLEATSTFVFITN